MLKLHGLRTYCSRVWKQSDAWRLRGSLLRARFSKEKSAAQIMDTFRTIMGKFRMNSRFLRFTTSVKLLMTRSIRGFRVSYNYPSVDGTVHCVVRLSAAFIIAKILLCKNR